MQLLRLAAIGLGIIASLTTIVKFAGPQSGSDVIRNIVGPSFPCGDRRILNDSERAVCSSWSLSRLDIRLANAYYDACGNLDKSLATEESSWLKSSRDACNGDNACLMAAYNARIDALTARKRDHCR
jgi:uncharacterized protein